jgi:hypothetical protein
VIAAGVPFLVGLFATVLLMVLTAVAVLALIVFYRDVYKGQDR